MEKVKQWINEQLEVFMPALLVLTLIGAIIGVFVGMICAANYLDSLQPPPSTPERYSYSYNYTADGYSYSYSYSYKKPEVLK